MSKPKILIVEDDPFSVQLLKHNLKSYPAELLPVANNVSDALKIAEAHEPDVALLDIYLGGEQDGLEIAQALQSRFDIPIIYLTGYSSEEIFESAKRTDPFGYILKPFTPKELTVTLDMALYKHAISKELKTQRALLSTTVEALHEAVLTVDSEGGIVFANSAARKLLGATAGGKLKDIAQLRLPHSDQPVELSPEIFGSAKAPVCKLKTAEGDRWVRVGFNPLPRAEQGTVVVFWDVSSEYEGQKTADTVFNALESITETLLLIRPDNDQIVFASSALEGMTGWKGAEVKGETPHFLFGPKSMNGFWGKVKEALKQNSYARFETIIYTKDAGEKLVEWQFGRMQGQPKTSENLYIALLRDISGIRSMEEELRQSQKIEAVGRLAGGVAHDFNNLLSVINSYADLLTLKLPEGDPLLKYVANIRTAGARASELVAKLLTFSRRDAPKPSMIDVKTLTQDVYKMLRRVIRENIEITTEFSDQLGVLWADQLQIEQVLMNLCVNARDAIDAEGKVKIAWSRKTLTGAEAEKLKVVGGNYLVLSVSDSGCGMDETTLSKIFEAYFTTKEKGKGTGLGLSIVYAICKQLKGAIEVKSSPAKGTTFQLYFPESERKEQPIAATATVTEAAGGHEHILIVEDEESFADCLQGVFSLHGYQVHYARDGASALEQIDNSIYPIKLLISDIMLPSMSGQELAKKLVAKFPDLKVIFITGYDNAVQILQDYPHNALVLQKPFSVVSILSKIREVLDNPLPDKKIQLL